MTLSYLAISKVHHVGLLDPCLKGSVHTHSHEGNCLSVSDCPEVWRQIARLGDAPCWELSRANGRFVRVHKSLGNRAVVRELNRWALAGELAAPMQVWAAYQEDLEDPGTWQFTLHDLESDARMELDDPSVLRPNGKPCLEQQTVLRATALLEQRIGFPLGSRPADEFLLACWVEDTQPDVDGLWWEDRLAPALLSAPRGGIFPSRVSRWDRSLCT